MKPIKVFTRYIGKFIRSHKLVICALLLWVPAQLVYYNFQGISHGGDTSRYIDAAKYMLLEHSIPEGKAVAYMGYNLFVAVMFFFGLGEKSIVLVQVLMSFIASICLYRLAYNVSINKVASFLAMVFYIYAPEIQSWNFYILTDSLFISMVIVSLYLISNVGNRYQFIYTVPIVVWSAFIRPTGFLLLIASILYLALKIYRLLDKKYYVYFIILVILCLPPLYYVVNKMTIQMQVVDNYLKGQIIWGYDANALSLPKNLQFDNFYGKNSIVDVVNFTLHNLNFVIKLAVLKLVYLYVHVKPFYAVSHNLMIAFFYYPVYYFAIIGLLTIENTPQKLLLVTYLIGQTIIVMLTFEDWDGRFLHAIMPIVYIFAAICLSRYLRRMPVYCRINKKIMLATNGSGTA